MNMNRFSYEDDYSGFTHKSNISETTSAVAPTCSHIMGYDDLFKSSDPPRVGKICVQE